MFFENILHSFHKVFIEQDRYLQFIEGFKNTLIITVGALLLGVVIGLIFAMFKVVASHNKKLKFLDIIAQVYLTVIRGTPVVLQLMIWYFIILASAKNAVPVAVLAFGINSGAYVCEIFRAGIESINKGQMEAGRSLGFTYSQTMGYIVLPQAFKNVLPALGNEFITLLKETSVAGYITVTDLTRAAYNVRNATYDSFTTLICTGLIYLILVMLITSLLSLLERRLKSSDLR